MRSPPLSGRIGGARGSGGGPPHAPLKPDLPRGFSLEPAGVDDEILRRAHGAVVGGEEEHHAGDGVGLNAVGQALALGDDVFAVFSSTQSSSCRFVMIQPGSTQLTRMRCLPRSRAKERVSASAPAFDAA